jgi:hypothetical protein
MSKYTYEEVTDMSLAELMPSVHALPRSDKFRLVQELIAELAQAEGLAEGEYPIWSPHEAHDAAAILIGLLDQEEKTISV